MNFRFLISIYTLVTLTVNLISAQSITQIIRGTAVDKVSQSPLPGATVILLNSNPINGTATDMDGNFKLEKVPLGNQTLKISFLGYKELLIPNIIVNSGKEVVLTISLEENIMQSKEVEIIDKVEKNKPLNEYSAVSARTFSVEETQKYAAAVNDPARMATAFAGVVSTEDGNNAIAIRGNSPNGLLWRMDGLEIPNPNHFSNVATSGGGISILSSQLLSNSDFSTGAFPAEYGNALSGVFDLKLRKGNNQKSEHTIQAGFLGTDISTEGPFKKGYNGSYLINYRYSTLSLLSQLGVNVGFGTTVFQDIAYNIYLPTKSYGNFSLFGFGGLSKQIVKAEKDSSQWDFNYKRYNVDFISNTGAAGFSHILPFNSTTYIKTSLVLAGTGKGYIEEKLDEDYTSVPTNNLDYTQNRISISSIVTKKLNAKSSIKTGVIGSKLFYDLLNTGLNSDSHQTETLIDDKGNAHTLQAFAQWNYHMTEKLNFVGGLHAITLIENETYSIEPRASIKYQFNPLQSIGFGYGLHSQIQPTGVYFVKVENMDGSTSKPNENLELTKSHHFVLSYDRSINEFLHLRAEAYYQYLFNVPISTDATNTFSMLNNEGGFFTDPLVNNGKGRNYGLEVTAEQYLHHDFYFLLSTSFYDSKFRASNNQWYNTRFNGNFATSFTAGKEFKTGEKFNHRIVGLNIKTIYSGGLRSTPIDFNASAAKGETVYIDAEAYSIQQKNYFRTDLKFSVKRNRKNSTITWALDIQNATNRKNVYGEYYDPLLNATTTEYQSSLIPILSYKIDF